jgi:hypothetical protein
MALLTGLHGEGPSVMLCAVPLPETPLSGMAPMYLLMCAVHLAPWLRLIGRRRRDNAEAATRGD